MEQEPSTAAQWSTPRRRTEDWSSTALTSGGRIACNAGTLQMQHFIRDHLGSVRTVMDGATGDVLETSDYLPFGKRWELTGGQAAQTITDPTNRWRFSGKETQSFYNSAIPYNDFGARLHDPRTGRWMGVDPMAEKYYANSIFSFCNNNWRFLSKLSPCPISKCATCPEAH